jgi:hypothetical protein
MTIQVSQSAPMIGRYTTWGRSLATESQFYAAVTNQNKNKIKGVKNPISL